MLKTNNGRCIKYVEDRPSNIFINMHALDDKGKQFQIVCSHIPSSIHKNEKWVSFDTSVTIAFTSVY